MWVQLSTTRSNVLKQPNVELLVAVNHSQLRIRASETLDPIDWSHPPPVWAVLSENHVHSINSATSACEATTAYSGGNHRLFGHSGYKGKAFYGQEPRSGESTTTECGFNYQLLAVIH